MHLLAFICMSKLFMNALLGKKVFQFLLVGMNAVVRSYVRMALYRGCKVYGIKNSFEGLCRGEVQVSE